MRKRIILFNKTGDLTLSWEEKDDKKMLDMVMNKMKEGFTFYSIHKNIFGIKKEVEVKNAKDIKKRKVILKDSEAERFYSNSHTAVVETTPDKEINIEKRLDTAEQVVESEATMCVAPVVGG